MADKRIVSWITFSLVLAGLAQGALAEDLVRDRDGDLVASIQGWENSKPVIVLPNGPRLVPLRVAPRYFETFAFAFFTSSNCTGTPFIQELSLENGVNAMQGRIAYVMKDDRRLYRTRPTNPARVRTQASVWQFGECKPAAGDVALVAANVFVRNLFLDYPPPFTVD